MRGAYRLLRFSHDYPDRRVRLDVWRVTSFEGVPASCEGQNLAWVPPTELPRWRLLPADVPIFASLQLPPLMLVTPNPVDTADFLPKLRRNLQAGIDLVQLRAPGTTLDELEPLARQAVAACREYGARLVLNAQPGWAQVFGADGVHLSQQQLRTGIAATCERNGMSLGISCHDAAEIETALACRPDYLILGPVGTTATHPDAKGLGWEEFARLATLSSVPVYAIGGLGLEDLDDARRYGAHGVAAIRALWGRDQLSSLS